MSIEGSQIPNVVLYEDNSDNLVNIRELFAGKKGLLIGIPGAFTPNCNSHLPDYIKNIDQLNAKGYEVIACVTVNDVFVTNAWSESLNASGKVKILADPNAQFTKEIKLDTYIRLLGGLRSKRYVLVVENNIVKKSFEEFDGVSLTCSAFHNVIKHLD